MRRKAWNGVYKLIDLGEDKEEKSTYHEIDIDVKIKENPVFEVEPEIEKVVVRDKEEEVMEPVKKEMEYKPQILDLDDDDDYNYDDEDENINKIIFDSEIKDFDDFDDFDDVDLDEDIESIISKI